jgi:hypothetical protein
MAAPRALTAAAAITIALLALPASPAAAAPGDRLDPVLVGTEGSGFILHTELDGGVYAIEGGLVHRIDGATPESFGPLFSSVNGMVGFQGALHLVSLAGDNTFEVVRLQTDGTSATTLNDAAVNFLGGIGRIGGFADELYATSSVENGEIAFATPDGITWAGSSYPGTPPDSIQSIVTVGETLFVDGFVGAVRGVYRWSVPNWILVPGIAGGLNTIAAGDGRLLVGTSEGLYSVTTGGVATELDGTVVNPRSMAEFDGEVWWVDDTNELRSIDSGGVRTVHDISPGAIATGALFATADALYYNTSIAQSVSTYRITLEPAGAPEEPELADTGSNDLVPLIGGIAIGIVVLGGALLIVRAVLARRSTSG